MHINVFLLMNLNLNSDHASGKRLHNIYVIINKQKDVFLAVDVYVNDRFLEVQHLPKSVYERTKEIKYK